MKTKLQLFLETEDIEQFKLYYYNNSNKSTCNKFNININLLKQICRYLHIFKSKEQIKKIKEPIYENKDWTDSVNKREQTCFKKYGVSNQNKLEECKQKIKATKLEKYGDTSYHNIDKMKQTNLEKYGNSCSFVNNEVKNKIKQTNLQKYGCENPQQCLEIRQKTQNTLLERYGVKYATLTINNRNACNSTVAKKKCANTKKKNKTFNTSKAEEIFYLELIKIFESVDVYRQYRDDIRYPFACDFYIKSKDLFIELNLNWTHGPHQYRPDSEEDSELLKKWANKAQSSKFYKNAINTWTVRDVEKYSYALKNNLNYLVFYSEEDCANFIKLTKE